MIIQAKRLTPSAILPTKSHATDAGWDLYAYDLAYDWDTEMLIANTGIAVAIPSGYYGQIFGRSGLAKRGITVLGGVIDSGYRGSIVVVLGQFSEDLYFDLKAGDRIAQLVILPVPEVVIEEVDKLPGSSRDVGGFGSSGR